MHFFNVAAIYGLLLLGLSSCGGGGHGSSGGGAGSGGGIVNSGTVGSGVGVFTHPVSAVVVKHK